MRKKVWKWMKKTQEWIFELSFADNGNKTTTYEVDRVG
jgi:hypothetical protein